MLAVAERGGRIRPQVPAVKALASALCIGSGGSVGREGPIVQIGSALGLGDRAGRARARARLRLLVACGAAGGISATFNAPIAGVFFALEVILRDFEARVVRRRRALSSVDRRRHRRGPRSARRSFLQLPAFTLALAGRVPALRRARARSPRVVGVAFIRVLYGTEDVADRLWRGPAWAAPGGRAGVAARARCCSRCRRCTASATRSARARGPRPRRRLRFVLVLLVGKIVATSLTIAIGGSGGVFAPSLFMGAMLGSAFGPASTHAAARAHRAGRRLRRWSGWARSSPAPRARRSPRC